MYAKMTTTFDPNPHLEIISQKKLNFEFQLSFVCSEREGRERGVKRVEAPLSIVASPSFSQMSPHLSLFLFPPLPFSVFSSILPFFLQISFQLFSLHLQLSLSNVRAAQS